MELILRRQKNPISFLIYFRALTTSFFWKEEDLGAKEASKRRPEGQKRVAHAAPIPGRMGPLIWALEALLPSIFVPVASS